MQMFLHIVESPYWVPPTGFRTGLGILMEDAAF